MNRQSNWMAAVMVALSGALGAGAWAGPIWEGVDPAPEPAWDKDATARRHLSAPAPAATAPAAAARMWYTREYGGSVPRAGRVMDISKLGWKKELCGTTVSVAMDKATPEAAYDEMTRATGLRVRPQDATLLRRTAQTPVSLSIAEKPLLEAMLQFSSMTGTRLQSLTPKAATLARTANETASPGTWCTAGAFAVVIERLESTIDFTQTNGRQASITFWFLAEPGVPVVRWPRSLELEKAVDNLDQPFTLEPSPDQGRPSSNVPGREVALPLGLPASRGKSIGQLKGTATFLLATSMKRLEIKPADTTIRQAVGGMNVELDPPVKNGSNLSVWVRYTQGELSQEEWLRYSAAMKDLHPEFLDVSGQPLNWYLQETVGGAETGSTGLNLRFGYSVRNQQTADKVTLDLPEGLREVKVPFDFTDLVMP